MRKRVLFILLTVLFAVTTVLASVLAVGGENGGEMASPEELEKSFYTDVAADAPYMQAVRALFNLGVLPAEETFRPEELCTQREFSELLYRLSRTMTVKEPSEPSANTVEWLRQTGAAGTEFVPENPLTREQSAAYAAKIAALSGIRLPKRQEPVVCWDSFRVSGYAQSGVAAMTAAGLLTAREDGRLDTQGTVLRWEAAALLHKLWLAAVTAQGSGTAFVSLEPDAYLDMYVNLPVFGEPVPESKPVPAAWFRSAAFVGDAALDLQAYNEASGTDWNARFLSSSDAETASELPAHVFLLPDGETGAANVEKLAAALRERSPETNIYLCALPGSGAAPVNEALRRLCGERGYYWLDTPAFVTVENGADWAAWTDYVAKHIPAALQTVERRFYSDVPEGAWYTPYIRSLFEAEVLPETERYRPDDESTRLEFVTALYRLYRLLSEDASASPEPSEAQEPTGSAEPVFTDVPTEGESFEAVMWGRESGVIRGTTETTFSPDAPLTREQCCAIMMRFGKAAGVDFETRGEPRAFSDSLAVSTYARSNVTACQTAGLVNGYDDGSFRPFGYVKRSEMAALLQRLLDAASVKNVQNPVPTEEDAFDWFYEELTPYDFGAPVPECDAVDASWFDDAVFVGDSVTETLKLYAASTGELGEAAFLSSVSLSARNALGALTEKSKHPTFNGVKMTVEDGVAASGAKNVYILLGVNSLADSVEVNIDALAKLVGRIKEKAPDVNIIIESVTPLIEGSKRADKNLNNQKIRDYNAEVRKLCEENEWYYLDIAEALQDEMGYLVRDYCGDIKSMGLHLNTAGARVWTEYLLTHVPKTLK